MPAVSANDQTTLASFPHSTRLGMAIFRPTAIVTGTVSGSASVGATSLTLASISTVRTPYKHYTVIAGSSAGESDGGKTRMKTWSSPTLTIAANNIDWNTYPYISILEEILPWAIIPDTSNDKEDGDVSYTDENLNYHPLAICGPPAVGWVDTAINFWSDSDAIASGASLSSHAWTFPSGSPSSSSSAGTSGSPIAVTWSAATGHNPHYVRYTVTDSNGKTHTAYRPAWVFTDFDTDVYCNWELESMDGDYGGGGWQARIRVFGDASTDEFPQDAMVVIFAEDRYAGTKTSIGGNWTHRENILFVGWIARDTVFKDNEKGDVSFELMGPSAKMKELNCWPANLEYVSGTPDTWHKLKGMTCDLAAFHLLTEHTTMANICDVVVSGNTKLMRFIDIPEGDPYQQIDEYCLKPIGGRLLSDRQGRMYFSRNVNLRPTSERTSITTVISLNISSDIRAEPGLDLATEEHEYQCSQVDFIGFGYDGNEARPWYSLAPENQYETGRVEKVDGIRADSQSEANELSGLYLANLNNIWREVRMPMFNYRIFDIAPEEYTKFTLAAGDTRRGIVWSSQKLLPRLVSIEYDRDRGALFVTPTFEKDTYGPSGVTGNYPVEPPDSPWDYPPPDQPEWPPDVNINPGSILIGDGTNGVWFIPAGAQSWEERDTGLDDTLVQQIGWDPWWFTAEKQNTTDPNYAIIWAVKVGKIYRSEDCGVTWEDVTPTDDPPNDWSDSPAAAVEDVTFIQRTDNIHKNKAHYFIAEWQNADSDWRAWLLVTEDDGVTWTWSSLMGGIAGSALAVETAHSSPYNVLLEGDSVESPAGSSANGYVSSQSAGEVHFLFTPTINSTSMSCTISVKQHTTGATVWALGIHRESDDAGFGTSTTRDAEAAWTEYTVDWTTSELIAGTQYYMTVSVPFAENVIVRDISLDIGASADTSVRPIWMDCDSQAGDYLWLTAWKGGILALQRRLTSTLGLDEEWSLGDCTIAQLGDKTFVAYPFTPTFDQDYCFVFGRMQSPQSLSNPTHLIKTDDAGSSFSEIENSYGDDHIGAFRAENDVDGQRTFYAIRNSTGDVPKLYRAVEGLSYISDLPFASGVFVLVDAMSVNFSDSRIAVGSNTAGSEMVAESQDNGATWSDITQNLPKTGEIRTVVYV